VTPLTLGIETLGGVSTPLIGRNTTIPSKKSQIFSTAADNQPAVTINVLQGERPMSVDNKSLGRFDLVGIPSAPRGVPQIEVTFDIDANGILNVAAKDLGTGKQQSIVITAPNKLKEDDIEKMKRDAESHAEEDRKKKDEIETINKADAFIYNTEKTLKDMEGKVKDGQVKDIRKHIDELKKLMEPEKKDIAKVKAKLEEIEKIAQAAATEMYQKAAAEQASKQKQSAGSAEGKNECGGKCGSGGSDEKVVDAEVVDEEKKEEKK
jgi:molecular chaperone DnaK